MQTPAGTDCPHYYQDFHRGRARQECRLIDSTPGGGRWAPDLCGRCSVPRIRMANACPNLMLDARVRPGLLGIGRGVEISASCVRSGEAVKEPEIGCGFCHEAFEFTESSPGGS